MVHQVNPICSLCYKFEKYGIKCHYHWDKKRECSHFQFGVESPEQYLVENDWYFLKLKKLTPNRVH